MAKVAIDPDGVLALSAATVGSAANLTAAAQILQERIDEVEHLVGRRPAVTRAVEPIASDLAALAGWAHDTAIHYIDDVKPLADLATTGFWLPDFGNLGWDGRLSAEQNIEKTATSDEFGSFVLGTAGALLARYRRFSLVAPRPGGTPFTLPIPDDVVAGQPVMRRPSGILVLQGGEADPSIPDMLERSRGPEFFQPGERTFVTDAELFRPPVWAAGASKGLGVAGGALVTYGSFTEQWDDDAEHHPEWGTGQRVASASYNALTEGGGAIAGGLYGAEVGATLGSFVPIPVVGTLGGALIGGAIGSFAGSKLGKAAGTLVKEGATHLWHSVFG